MQLEKSENTEGLGKAAAWNAGLAVFDEVMFRFTGNPAYRAGVNHDILDVGNHGFKYVAQKLGWNQEGKLLKNTVRLGMALLCVGSLNSVKENVDELRAGPERLPVPEQLVNVAAAGVIAEGNRRAHKAVHEVKNKSNVTKSSEHHAKFDLFASRGLAASLVLEIAIPGASYIGGAGFAAYTTYEASKQVVNPFGHSHD